MSFESSIKQMTRTLRNTDKLFKKAVLDNEAQILDANTAQLEHGQDALGNLLEEYHQDWYKEFKQREGSQAPFGIPNLYLEGDFYDGFILKYDGSKFEISSTDSKRDALAAKYGEDIFGLQSFDKIDLLESFLIYLRDGMLR